MDIPRRNSPYYVACTRTWIFEPSVYLSGCEIKWQACVIAYSCDKLFSESHHFSWDIGPANTMTYCTLPRDWSYQGDVMRKKTCWLGKNLPAWWWSTVHGVRIVYYYWNVSFVESRRHLILFFLIEFTFFNLFYFIYFTYVRLVVLH